MSMRKEVVDRMRENGWLVREVSGRLNLTKQYGIKSSKTISFDLVQNRKKYIITHPSYNFINVIAYYKSAETEKRLSLNKTILESVIKSLKEADVWSSIENKGFIEVNDFNKKSDKEEVSAQLKKLLRVK